MDSDVLSALRARGHDMDAPGALGAILHSDPDSVRAHHEAELACKVDVLCALTGDTSPRSLSESGMEHRSARLTALALDLVTEVGNGGLRPVAIAGVLGSDQLAATSRARFEGETNEQAARVAFGGAEIVIVRGVGSRLHLVLGVDAVAAHDLPSWAVLDPSWASPPEIPELLESLIDSGAEAALFEVPSVDEGIFRLQAARAQADRIVLGALLSAAPDALRGFPSPLLSSWVDRAVELTDAGARIIGGGAGTTEEHTRALAMRLGILHPSLPPLRDSAGGTGMGV